MSRLFKLDFSNLRGDVFGGITAGIVALPLALAFGAQTELGAIAGLYGAIGLAILAAFFGGTPSQVSGPTAPMTVVSAVVILEATKAGGDLSSSMPLIIATFAFSGILEFLLGVLRVGRYVKFIPYPVVSGFMSGIGVIIIIGQLFPFLGATAPKGNSLDILLDLPRLFASINWAAFSIALATVVIIYLFPRITKKIPGTLVALVAVSAAAYWIYQRNQFGIINDGMAGGIPSGLPTLHLDFFSAFLNTQNIGFIVKYGFTLAFLGAIDSLLTSIVADNLTKTRHDSNRELIGQGIGNFGSALIGGLPGAGATLRTVVNIQAGGKTRISGMLTGFFLLIVLLGLGKVVGLIPNAVLAGILLTVGIGIIDYKGMRHLRQIPRTDAVIMIVVLLLTVFIGLLEAVAIGMVMASLLFMKAISDVVEKKTRFAPLQEYSPEIPWSDEPTLTAQIGERVYIKHLDGPLFFGFASRMGEIIRQNPKIQVVIIRMGRVPYVDQSGLYAMEDAVQEVQKKGVTVVFTGLRGQPKDMFERIQLVPGLVPKEFCFPSFADCVIWLEGFLQDKFDYHAK